MSIFPPAASPALPCFPWFLSGCSCIGYKQNIGSRLALLEAIRCASVDIPPHPGITFAFRALHGS